MDKEVEKLLNLKQRLARSHNIKDFSSFDITEEKELFGDSIEIHFQWNEKGEIKKGAGLFETSEVEMMKNNF